jgi:hypothetical protein
MKASQAHERGPEPGRGKGGRRAGEERPAARGHDLNLLQQAAGNRAVSRLLAGDEPATRLWPAEQGQAEQGKAVQGKAVQRVPITAPTRQETLFNQRPTPGQAGAAVYGGNAGATLDMSRGGTPDAVTVTVRIRFVDQTRSATGADTGAKNVIPAGDPRRAWAQGMCTTAPGVWNGRARLAGQREARTGLGGMISPDPGGPVRLPLVFRAVPVWDLTSPADKEVRVFSSATVAGSAGHPIDAAHYYMNRGGYPFSEEAIYAHEYGHLIGLADEYSQSNPQMHAVMHDVDPGTAATRGAALDRETVRRMVMAALTRPLYNRVSAAGGEISAALRRGAGPVRQSLAGQLRAALIAPAVRGLFELGAPAASARLAPRIHALVNAATAAARNTSGVAGRVVAAELAPAALGGMINSRYYRALMSVHGNADVGGLGVNITIEGHAGIDANGVAVPGVPPVGVWNAAAAGPAAGNATGVADRTIGALQTGRVPPVRPSGALLRQLESLPAGWAAFSAAAPAALSSGVLQADLSTALTAAWLARMVGGGAGAPITRSRALAAAVDGSVRNAATAAATNAVRAFLNAEINPVLQTSVTALTAAVGEEVDRVMATPAGALAAAAPKDPDLAALAGSLNTQLKAQAAAATATQAATPGTTPVNPGATAPAQSVTYGTVNMMSDNTSVFRPDQFAELANQFNGSGLRRDREGTFHAETV